MVVQSGLRLSPVKPEGPRPDCHARRSRVRVPSLPLFHSELGARETMRHGGKSAGAFR
jgi:hypothetical protein